MSVWQQAAAISWWTVVIWWGGLANYRLWQWRRVG